MNKSEALDKIQYSLKSEEVQVITPQRETYEEYVEKLSRMLIDSVIDPVKATITSACAKEGAFELYKNSEVWAIARKNDNWLLTLEGKQEFALGFGDDLNNIMMHGFSSADALGEWCV